MGRRAVSEKGWGGALRAAKLLERNKAMGKDNRFKLSM